MLMAFSWDSLCLNQENFSEVCFLHDIFIKSNFEHFVCLCCSVLRLKQNLTQIFCSFIRQSQIALNIHTKHLVRNSAGVIVTKLTRLSQKIVILCPGWQKAIQPAIHSPNDEFWNFWLCFCMCAAPATISQPVPSVFKRELDALWNMRPSHLICIAASKVHTNSFGAFCDFFKINTFHTCP
jgi:hypothetical protein